MLVATIGLALLAPPTVSSAASPPTLYPPAGTETAHEDTDVSVRDVDADDVEVVAVTGSTSGRAQPALRPHADGRGATIDLDGSLAPEEDVVVDLRVDGRPVRHRFSTAEVAEQPRVQVEDRDRDVPGDAAASAAAQPLRFVSEPDLRPPAITVSTPATVERDGYLLATPGAQPESDRGMMMFDDTGELVWFKPHEDPTTNVGDLKVLDWDGRRVLAWFEGSAPLSPGHHRGEWIVVDDTYREIVRIRAGNGMQADVHDLQLTEAGTALLLVYHPVVRDLTSVGGRSDALVLEAVVQEVDVSSGDVLFEWHSLDHIPLSDSYVPLTGAQVDYVHINAVEEDVDGNLLLSLRHTSQIIKIDRETGDVIWRLGGKRSTFDLGGDVGISYPHDVRTTGTGVSIFDNGNLREPPYSRGVVYDLDVDTRTATLVAEYRNTPEDSFGPTRGSMRLLEDGTASITWGGLGIITEMEATGAETFEASIAADSYRIIREEWTGRPTGPPAVAVTGHGSSPVAHASWNGATEVASWELLAGPDPSRLTVVTTASRDGFETSISVPGDHRFVAVRAVDSDGRRLSRSAAVPTDGWYEERVPRQAGGIHRPIAGQFIGGPQDDILWFGPGAVRESLWPADGTGFGPTVATPQSSGDYQHVVGDFFGDDHDEVVFWQPRSTTAYVWSWQDGDVTSYRVRVPPVDRAILLDHTAGPDEVLWYGFGSAPDRIAGWRRDGTGLRVTSRAASVQGSFFTTSGDFDANGWADVLWFRPGAGLDYVWHTEGVTGASTGHTSTTFDVAGDYQPVVSRLDPSGDAADDVLWIGGWDWLWTGRTDRTFDSARVSVPAGDPVALPGGRDHVLLRGSDGTDHVVRSARGAPFVMPTRNTSLPLGATAVVGDFVEAGQASLFWYQPGPGAERLFVSPDG